MAYPKYSGHGRIERNKLISKKIKMLKRDIAELKEKANSAGQVNKKRILNKIEKLKAKLPKRVQ